MRNRQLGRRQFLKAATGTFAGFGAMSAIARARIAGAKQAGGTRREKPNVVLIMLDDLGYHDLACYGHESIKTPVIDKLATDGVRLTSFYAGATVCTPSRMALLTGAYPTRVGWTKGVLGYLISTDKGLSTKALTMPRVFKSAGYRTGLFGKWHLGQRPGLLPMDHGFDDTYYLKASNNLSKKIWRGAKQAADAFDNGRLTEYFTRESIRFVKENKDRPFFLYLPYTAPHFPVRAHPDWKGKSAYGVYGDVVEEVDSRIGELLATLRAEKLDRDTIVVFLSDNGPQGGQGSRANPYRGKKWSALEGGTRVPCIVRFPGHIPAGATSDALIAAIDLLPTLCHACGIDLGALARSGPGMDGVNVWPTLLGKTDQPHARKELLYWHGKKGFQAIRVGDWKLFLDRADAELKDAGKGPALFHLAEDPTESRDVSDKHPDRVAAMQKLAEKRLAEINKNVLPLGSVIDGDGQGRAG